MKTKTKQFKRKKPKLQKKQPVYVEGLSRYIEDSSADQGWIDFKISVPTEFDKDQLLKAFKYIHDLRTLDTGYIAVNCLVHTYTCSGTITVDPSYVSETVPLDPLYAR